MACDYKNEVGCPLIGTLYAAPYPTRLTMSITTIPLHLLDCFRVRISLKSGTPSGFSWDVQTTIDRRPTEDVESTTTDPCIIVDLVRTKTLDSIQICTLLPSPQCPSTSSPSVSTGMCLLPAHSLRCSPSLIIDLLAMQIVGKAQLPTGPEML